MRLTDTLKIVTGKTTKVVRTDKLLFYHVATKLFLDIYFIQVPQGVHHYRSQTGYSQLDYLCFIICAKFEDDNEA